VVAGVIRDPQGRLLLAQRPQGKHLAGTWEFPGGKLESGESPMSGMARELDEELGIRVHASRPLLSLTHAYPEKTVRLLLREVCDWDGEPHSREGQPIAWFALEQMHDLAMPAADRPMLKALGLDPRYLIAPDPARFPTPADFLADWEACLATGYRWLQLGAGALDRNAFRELATACGDLARRYGARWLISDDVQLAVDAGADGVHLSTKALIRCRVRPLPESKLVCASCRDIDDLQLAGRLGLDFVTVGPVLRSAAQPGAQTLGWDGLAELCAKSPLPVLAQGGLSPPDLERAREHGAFGIAGSDGFPP